MTTRALRFSGMALHDRDIEKLRAIVDSDPNDTRARLELGDLQARAGAFGDAVATYSIAAEWYGAEGFLLKAIAVERAVRDLITKQRPDLRDIYLQSTHKLASHYAALGLTSEAEGMLAELESLRAGGPYR
jgi:lipopolysaccharide biosynthesis regulator YciM